MLKFVQQNPFSRLLIPLIAGILLFRLYPGILQMGLWILLIVSLILIILSYLFTKVHVQYKFRWLFGCGIFFVMILCGYISSKHKESKSVFDHLDKKGLFLVKIESSPIEKKNTYQYRIKLIQYLDSTNWNPAIGHAILYLQKDSCSENIIIGDKIILDTEFNEVRKALNPNSFDYQKYLHLQGVDATAYCASGRWFGTEQSSKFSLRRIADNCRRKLLDIFKESGISGRNFAVLAAVTLGYTEEMDVETRDSFAGSGVMHVLAVSGLHVGIIYVLLMFLFKPLSKSNKKQIILTTIIMLLLWIYAYITGLSPSVVRSTLMFTFIAIGACTNRYSNTYNTICMSAFLMLMINPNYLFSIGFQLSYSAVFSIIFFTRLMKGDTINNKFLRWTFNLLIVSFAAQLATAPFTIYYFHQFPTYFLLTNFIVVPAITVIINLAVFLLIISFIPFLSAFIAKLLDLLLSFVNGTVDIIHNFPFSQWFVSINIIQLLLFFLTFFCILAFLRNRKYVSLITGLCALFIVFTIDLYTKYETVMSNRVVVFAGIKHTHVSFISGNTQCCFSTNWNEFNKIAQPFWLNQKINKPTDIVLESCYYDHFVFFNGLSFYLLTDDVLKDMTAQSNVEMDYLIIGGGIKPKIEQITKCINPKCIIVDNTISKWYSEQIRQYCKREKISFYSTTEGAYMIFVE